MQGLVFAGDYTGGPQPQETIDLMRSLGGWMIRGNSEDMVLAYDAGQAPEAWRLSKEWATFRWSYERLNRETLHFIAGLPEQCIVSLAGAAPIRVIHGTPRSPSEFLYPDRDPVTLDIYRRAGLLPPDRDPDTLAKVLAGIEEPVLICAHSHIPWIQSEDGLLVVNPGSVSGPNNEDVRARWALLTWQSGRWQATLQTVEYDLADIAAVFRGSGLLAAGGAMAQTYLLLTLTGHNVPRRFVDTCVVYLQAGQGPETPVSEDVWYRAVETSTGGRTCERSPPPTRLDSI